MLSRSAIIHQTLQIVPGLELKSLSLCADNELNATGARCWRRRASASRTSRLANEENFYRPSKENMSSSLIFDPGFLIPPLLTPVFSLSSNLNLFFPSYLHILPIFHLSYCLFSLVSFAVLVPCASTGSDSLSGITLIAV